MAYYQNQQGMEDAYNKGGRQGSWETFQSQNKIGADPYSQPQQTGGFQTPSPWNTTQQVGGWGTPTPQPVSGWGAGSEQLYNPNQNRWTPRGTSGTLGGTNTEVKVGAAYNGGSGNTGWGPTSGTWGAPTSGGIVPQSQGGSPAPNPRYATNGYVSNPADNSSLYLPGQEMLGSGGGGQPQQGANQSQSVFGNNTGAYYPNEQAMETGYNNAGRPGTWEQWQAQNHIGTDPNGGGGNTGPTGPWLGPLPGQSDMPWKTGQTQGNVDQTMRDYQTWQAQWMQQQANQQYAQWQWQNPLDQQQAYGRWAMEQDANQRANTEADRQLAMQTSTGYNPYARHGYTNNAGYSRPVKTIG